MLVCITKRKMVDDGPQWVKNGNVYEIDYIL